jgi:uncharacterized protein YqfB (UPF0267 family)
MANIVKHLRFGYNWNNKLSGRYFTTLRLWNETRYQPGEAFTVWLNETYLGEAELVSIRKIFPDRLNEFICGLDTGYSVPETRKILERMYKGKENHGLMLGLLKWVKREAYTDEQLAEIAKRKPANAN